MLPLLHYHTQCCHEYPLTCSLRNLHKISLWALSLSVGLLGHRICTYLVSVITSRRDPRTVAQISGITRSTFGFPSSCIPPCQHSAQPSIVIIPFWCGTYIANGNIFLHSAISLLTLCTVSFVEQNPLILMQSNLSTRFAL